MPMDIPDNKFQERRPAAWSPECPDGDIGGGVRRVTPAFGQCVEEACNKLGQLLQVEARSPTGARAAVLRVTPKVVCGTAWRPCLGPPRTG